MKKIIAEALGIGVMWAGVLSAIASWLYQAYVFLKYGAWPPLSPIDGLKMASSVDVMPWQASWPGLTIILDFFNLGFFLIPFAVFIAVVPLSLIDKQK